MVFVWSNLTDGEPPRFIRIALDDTSIVFAAAPMVGLLLGLSSITVLWVSPCLSGVLWIVGPVIAVSVVAVCCSHRVARPRWRRRGVEDSRCRFWLCWRAGFQGDQM